MKFAISKEPLCDQSFLSERHRYPFDIWYTNEPDIPLDMRVHFKLEHVTLEDNSVGYAGSFRTLFDQPERVCWATNHFWSSLVLLRLDDEIIDSFHPSDDYILGVIDDLKIRGLFEAVKHLSTFKRFDRVFASINKG